MKKLIFLLAAPVLCLQLFAQVKITAGAQWVNSGNVTVVINDMDLVNDGTFSTGTSIVRFTGDQNSSISGTSLPLFNILEIAKGNGSVLLSRNISVGSSVNFISGLLDLNNNNILLNTSAYLSGESENSRITGTNGGFIEISQDLNAPLSSNPGNLGAIITSNTDLGTVTIKRGHAPQSGTGLAASTHRYFSIAAQNNNGLDATLRLKYFDAELNGQDENIMAIYQSNDNGANWANMSQTSRNATSNYVEKTGMNTLSLETLANDSTVTPPDTTSGVTGLVFNAKRKKPTEVQLTWTTQTETNMDGFEVQRRLKNEPDFIVRGFVNTLSPGGNSNSQLSYNYIDPNDYADTSFYRLRIVDLNGNFTYSEIRFVAPKTKGGGGNSGGNPHNAKGDSTITTMAVKGASQANTQKLTIAPNPNNGNFWFMISGLAKETTVTLYTLDGKSLKQFKVNNLQQQQVSGLKSGVYLLKVPGMETAKIIVLGGGSESNPAISTPAKN